MDLTKREKEVMILALDFYTKVRSGSEGAKETGALSVKIKSPDWDV